MSRLSLKVALRFRDVIGICSGIFEDISREVFEHSGYMDKELSRKASKVFSSFKSPFRSVIEHRRISW